MLSFCIMTDSFRIASQFAQRLESHKLDLAMLLRRAGLPANFFAQEKIMATTDELFRLWSAIGQSTNEPLIGLKLGSEPRIERFQPTMIAALCSRSLRDAIQRMSRYKQLVSPEEIRITQKGSEAAVEFVFAYAKDPEPEVIVDNCLSWVLAIGKRGTEGRIAPIRLELTRPSEHRDLLEKHYGCRVKFKAERNALIFANSDLDLSFTSHNTELLAAVGAQLETELELKQAGNDVSSQVKHALRRSMAGKRPTLQDVATELGIGSRTLQRKLTDAGLTFQQLVEETRRELAHHYLKQGTVELTETAYLLGFADANSFFRAFNGWEGVTPGEWRSQHGMAHA